MYCPPDLGNMPDSSAKASAPSRVMTPAMSQDSNSHPPPAVVRAMSALTMNMPEPIMDPATRNTPSINLNLTMLIFE